MKRNCNGGRVLHGAVAALAVLLGAAPCWAATAPEPAVTSRPSAPPLAPARDAYDGPPLLLDAKKLRVGGYAGLGGAYTRFLGRSSGLMSFEAAVLLDHRFSIGLSAYGFTQMPRGPSTAEGERQRFGSGYGGFAVRYSVLGKAPVYGTFGLVLGAGAVDLRPNDAWSDEEAWDDAFPDDERRWSPGRVDVFLVAQPEIALNANVTRWLRVGLNAGYRFTGGVSRFGLSERDLNGLLAGASIQLGWF
jgi:hypothetical protein